jgi:hypothetical protein
LSHSVKTLLAVAEMVLLLHDHLVFHVTMKAIITLFLANKLGFINLVFMQDANIC